MGDLMAEAYRTLNGYERTAGIQVERRISHEDMMSGGPFNPPPKNPSAGPKSLAEELKEAYLYTNSKEFSEVKHAITTSLLKSAQQGTKDIRHYLTSKEVRYKDQIMKWLLDQGVKVEWVSEVHEGTWIAVKVM